jgi:hypothetical protein
MEEKSSIVNPQINDQIVKTEAAPIDKKFRFSRKMLALLSVFCILILVLVVSGGAYVMNSNKVIDISPTPTIAPTPTSSPSATPTPTVLPRITYKPTSIPTPAKDAPLIILITPEKNSANPNKTVTITNLSTNQTFTRIGQGYIQIHDATTATYRVKVDDIPDHKTSNSTCDTACVGNSFNYKNTQYGNTREISVDTKTSRGVSFYWIPNSAVPNCTGGGSGPYCL